ncbi:MAG TPA: 4Fe-4S binding protein [Geobacteraceae bacterium]
MNITSATLIYFSPTRTTRKVLEGIAQGARIVAAEHLDLTPPEAMTQQAVEIRDDLAIIGSPVYGGRLPAEMISRFRRTRGNGTPAVIVAVYGNRGYEDALLELRDIALAAGFTPVAAGAFVGEHSFSGNGTPIGVGRPDGKDLTKAEEFGKLVREKMGHLRALGGMPPLRVPGNFPYKELRLPGGIAPVIDETSCATCGRCVPFCPTGAINAAATDSGLCIRCCACIKSCPAGARTMAEPRMRRLAEQLAVNCGERKEPETYF